MKNQQKECWPVTSMPASQNCFSIQVIYLLIFSCDLVPIWGWGDYNMDNTKECHRSADTTPSNKEADIII